MVKSGNALRVLLVDDSQQVRKAMSLLIEKELSPVKITQAANGSQALQYTADTDFDLVCLDLSMPVMDGFTFLRMFRTRHKTPVLVVSSLVDIIYVDRALEMGADAFLGKPGDFQRDEEGMREELRLKLYKLLPEVMRKRRAQAKAKILEEVKGQAEKGKYPTGDFPVVVVGCSSGGPPTIQYLLSALPREIDGAVIIAQHMPLGFIGTMVERLKRLLTVPMKEAADGEEIRPGMVYFCPGGVHTVVRKREGIYPILVTEKPKGKDISPSVDMLFESAANAFKSRLTGMILTGMGRDGSVGVVKVKGLGGEVVAESDATAAIYGMPREAVATGSVDKVLPLPEISTLLIKKLVTVLG